MLDDNVILKYINIIENKYDNLNEFKNIVIDHIHKNLNINKDLLNKKKLSELKKLFELSKKIILIKSTKEILASDKIKNTFKKFTTKEKELKELIIKLLKDNQSEENSDDSYDIWKELDELVSPEHSEYISTKSENNTNFESLNDQLPGSRYPTGTEETDLNKNSSNQSSDSSFFNFLLEDANNITTTVTEGISNFATTAREGASNLGKNVSGGISTLLDLFLKTNNEIDSDGLVPTYIDSSSSSEKYDDEDENSLESIKTEYSDPLNEELEKYSDPDVVDSADKAMEEYYLGGGSK